MNKLDLHPPFLTQPADARSGIPALQHESVHASLEQSRLLVLIPADLDSCTMTRQIWELANATHASVQLLGLCKNGIEEPALRRKLTTVCALIQEGNVSAEAKSEVGANWVDVIRHNQQKGDVVVCFAEQRAGFLQRPLSQILQSNLDAQVYVLSDLNAHPLPRPNWFSQIMAWIGSAGIIILAFLLQVRITSLPQDWAQTTLLILSVAGEIWLIWAWNNLLS